jgi:hypothetical protein
MKRIQKIAGLVLAAALIAAAGSAQAQIVTAGELFVDLRANDYTSQSEVSALVNNGTLPDFIKWKFDAGEGTNVVGEYEVTRGVQIRADDDGFVLSADGIDGTNAPAGLLGNSDWTVETWVWIVPQGGEQCIVGIGQRNGPNESQAQLCVGSIAFVGWGEDFGWGGGGNTPNDENWHHIVYVHTGDPDTNGGVDPPSDNANDGQVLIYKNGVLTVTANLADPLDIGDFWTANAAPLAPNATPKAYHALTVGGTMQGATLTATWANGNNTACAINRVRIHDGALTSTSILNNYDFEKAEFVEKPVPPQPRVGWRNPTSGRALNFGDVTVGNSAVEQIRFKNTGLAGLEVSGYALSGPDAAAFSLTPSNPTTGTLAPDAEISFNVTFTPTAAAEANATLAIDFGTTLGLANIALRGNTTRIFVATSANGGSDVTGNGSPGTPYASLSKALEEAELGDVIQMAAGTYGVTSAPDLPDATRVAHVIGVGNVTILVPQAGTSFDIESQQFPNPNIPPPPPGVIFPAPDPNAQVYDWNDSTLSFENVTFDSAYNTTTDSGDEPMRLNGSGTFDIELINCRLLNNWGTAALQGDLNGAVDRLTGGVKPFIRLSAQDAVFKGDGPNERHSGVLLEANEVEVSLINCDLRGGEGGDTNLVVESARYPAMVVLENCQFGGLGSTVPDRGIDVGAGVDSVDGTTVIMNNCTFNGYGVEAFNAERKVTFYATGCIFQTDQAGAAFSLDFGDIVQNSAAQDVFITDCLFIGPVGSHLDMYEGMDLRVTNSVITGNRNQGVLILDNTGGEVQSTVSLVGNVIDAGNTVTAANANPAAVEVLTPVLRADFRMNRNTIRAVDTGATTPTWTQHGSALRTDRVRSGVFEFASNVIEGPETVIIVEPNNTGTQSSPLVQNNTIVGLADGLGATVVAVNGTHTQVPTIRGNAILGGYATLKNIAGGTAVNNHVDASGEPGFIAPFPFAAPAVPGVSDYHLRGISLLINATATTTTAARIDRDGVDRETVAGAWDIGAYEFVPGANPVNHWTWF